MFLSFYDESGDDGFPEFSSPLFVMTCLYMNSRDWKDNYEKVVKFRQFLKNDFNVPIKEELHTKQFIQDKGDYHGKYTPDIRKKILKYYFKLINVLNVKIINVAIDKRKAKNQDRINYNVLEKAFSYSIQRLENDMNKNNSGSKFIIITDEGRIWAMKKIARKIQKINFIPSQFNPDSYRKEIENLVEDPLPKKSHDSYFIQLADLVSYIVSLYALQNLVDTKIDWGKRVRQVLDYGDERKLLDSILGRLNTEASSKNKYGIVYYPK